MRILIVMLTALLNLAPAAGQPVAPMSVPLTTASMIVLVQAPPKLRQELEGLPGEAEAIIRGRPYAHPDELVRRKIIPAALYERIKQRLVADGQRP